MTNKPTIETIKFTIPGTDRKLIIQTHKKPATLWRLKQ